MHGVPCEGMGVNARVSNAGRVRRGVPRLPTTSNNIQQHPTTSNQYPVMSSSVQQCPAVCSNVQRTTCSQGSTTLSTMLHLVPSYFILTCSQLHALLLCGLETACQVLHRACVPGLSNVPPMLPPPSAIPCTGAANGPIPAGNKGDGTTSCPSTPADGSSCNIDTLCTAGYEYVPADPTCSVGPAWSTDPNTLSCSGVELLDSCVAWATAGQSCIWGVPSEGMGMHVRVSNAGHVRRRGSPPLLPATSHNPNNIHKVTNNVQRCGAKSNKQTCGRGSATQSSICFM